MEEIERRNKELLEEVERLKRQIKILKSKKKYGLVWEEEKEPEKIVSDCERKIPILKEITLKEIISDREKPINVLIEGDNYHALSVLNYTHKNKIDVIYIDPPYNTGSKSWKYNNQYIERDDTFRHSKWLSFMSQRLRLAKNLLKDDGVLIVTIDDYEVHTLGLLLNEIFGEDNRMSTLIIESNPRGRTSDAFFATSHEYYLYYAKNSTLVNFFNPPLTKEQEEAFKFEDEISRYRLLPLRKSGAASRRNDRPKQYYPIYIRESDLSLSLENFEEKSIELWPIDEIGEERVWKVGVKTCGELIESGDIIASKNRKGKITLSQKDRIKTGRKPKTVWLDPKYDASTYGTILISTILGKANVFDYPKSIYAVIDSLIVLLKEKKDAVVVDFFAGSGTTGHAVLELNKEDRGNRQFILCTNNESSICTDVCYPRIKKVIEGYENLKGEKVEGLGGNLKYFKTELLDIDHISHISDEQKIKLTYHAGEMIALREGTFIDVEKNEWWQIFRNRTKYTAIYFKEDKSRLNELVEKLSKHKEKITLYIFSWGKNEYKNEFTEYKNIKVEDIPEPIIDVYKEVNRWR